MGKSKGGSMTIKAFTRDDICLKTVVECSPEEYLILNKALKQFIENKVNVPENIQIAEKMDLAEIEFIEEEYDGTDN